MFFKIYYFLKKQINKNNLKKKLQYIILIMSDYGITMGWYKNKNEENDNGVLINVFYITKKFVKVKIYNFYDNIIDINNLDENNRRFKARCENKIKVDENKLIYPYQTKFIRSFNLSPEYKLS